MAKRCTCTRVYTRLPRATAKERGYDAQWRHFRLLFFAALAERGILPVCGSSIQGLRLEDSRCAQLGMLSIRSAHDASLHVDHIVPLTDADRRDARAVCRLDNVQLLCDACHAQKTEREQAFFARDDRGATEMLSPNGPANPASPSRVFERGSLEHGSNR